MNEREGKILNKSNYIFLGVAIGYFVIAIVQSTEDIILPAAVYVTITFVSLELTLFETIKKLLELIVKNMKQLNAKIKWQEEFIDRIIKIYYKFSDCDVEIRKMKSELTELKSNYDILRNVKTIKKMEKLISFTTCIQTIFCTVLIIITPLKLIPYDSFTSKLINTLTIMSFAFTFLSYFIFNTFEEERRNIDLKYEIYETVSLDYLKILEKIAMQDKNL